MAGGEMPIRKPSSESRSLFILAGIVGVSGLLCYAVRERTASLRRSKAILLSLPPWCQG
jgi:hypothetical protein